MARNVLSEESKLVISGGFEFSLPVHMNYGKLFVDRILKYGNKIAMVSSFLFDFEIDIFYIVLRPNSTKMLF